MTLTPNPYESKPSKQPNINRRLCTFGKNALLLLGFAVGSAYAVGDKASQLVKKVGEGYLDYEYNNNDPNGN